MTRTRNASFVCTTHGASDIDAINITTTLREIVQDLHRVYDVALGANGIDAADVMDHSGVPNGSPLGIPIISQLINRAFDLSDDDVATYGGEVMLFAAPAFITDGDAGRLFRARIYSFNDLLPAMTLRVYDSSGALQVDTTMAVLAGSQFPDDDEFIDAGTAAEAAFTLAGAGRHVFVVVANLTHARAFDIMGWSIAPLVQMPNSTGTPGTDLGTFPVPEAASGSCINFVDIPDEMFSVDLPTTGWLVNRLNRNINALWEALTGAPVDGHAELTNEDSDDVSPTTSRFVAHSQRGTEFVDEPEIQFPLMAAAFGAARLNGEAITDSGRSAGVADWNAPNPTSDAETFGPTMRGFVPRFPHSGVGNGSKLKGCILATHDPATDDIALWKGNIEEAVGHNAGTQADFVQLGSTNLWVCDIEDIPFFGDVLWAFRPAVEKPGGPAPSFGEILILGACLHFDP